MRWLAKHWLTVAAVLISALYVYLQLLQWRNHGDDLMPVAANLCVTAVLWIVLAAAIGRYWSSGRAAKGKQESPLIGLVSDSVLMQRVGFEYLPKSPLECGWTKAYGDANPSFS